MRERLAARSNRRPAHPAASATRAGPGLARFLRDERGAFSVDFTVVVPFFVFLLVLFADATVIYLTHTEMYGAARDISRRIATGELQTDAEVQAYAADRLHLGSRNYYVGLDFANDKTVMIVVNLGDAAIFGYFFRPVLGRELVAASTVGEEPRIE